MGERKCMVCGKLAPIVRGGICEPCQEKIRREAMGEQADVRDRAERELKRQGINPVPGKEKK